MAVHEASQQAISGLQAQRLWNYFLEISQIPRESGNEDQVRAYLIAFAQQHGFDYHVDSIGNVIIRVPAARGM